MDYYQPYSLLFYDSNSTPKTMRINTRGYVPGNQNIKVKVTMDSGETAFGVVSTNIAITAILSSVELEARIVEVIKELAWNGSSHTVYTDVYDLANQSKGKNALHTTGATQY